MCRKNKCRGKRTHEKGTGRHIDHIRKLLYLVHIMSGAQKYQLLRLIMQGKIGGK